MSLVDVEKIINGTPTKRIINGYNAMKENYNEASTQEFKDIYSNEPLTAVIENSRMIFSEPYFGLSYYKEAIETLPCALFTKLYEESEKVKSFLEENGSKMGEKQKALYESLSDSLATLLESTKNTRLYASYIKENVDETFEDKLASAMESYRKEPESSLENLVQLFESVKEPLIYFTYAPYVCNVLESNGDATAIENLAENFCEETSVDSTEEVWANFVEKVICENKLKLDSKYMEAVSAMSIKDTRIVFEYYMNTDLSSVLNEVVTEKVNYDVTHVTPELAVNSLLLDMMESVTYADDNEENKKKLDTLAGIAYEATLNILVAEYQGSELSEDGKCNVVAEGYALVPENQTLEEGFTYLNNLYQESVGYITESEEDVSDDDVDNLDKEDKSAKTEETTTGKKPSAPKAKNLANRIQFKAMDKEAQQMKKASIRKQKGQEIGNAVKAVAQLPLNVVNDIKAQVHKLDKLDDDRRKKYMVEPGFRKKAFRNLKLAILYGSAANVKLALVPVVAISRHFSKMKDRRIRNETIRELNTEIKICEEKINDANANNDTQEKYRLIRIKDQLDAEMVRVKTNSKYV